MHTGAVYPDPTYVERNILRAPRTVNRNNSIFIRSTMGV
jgi:hypothetical protein